MRSAKRGRNDKSGAWMYISGLSFIAFLLTTVTLIVLGSYVLATRRRNPARPCGPLTDTGW